MSIFITGTDTDIGKTVVTAGLASAIESLGYLVGVFKPIQTGSPKIDNKFVSPDLEFVKSISSSILTHASYNFTEPVAPSLAADLDKTDIDIKKIIEDYRELKKKCDFVIVEGAGGLLVPIKDNFTMRDLAKSLNLPLLIVSRPNLGTINHTLLTVEAARNKGLEITGIIISGYPSDTKDIAIKNAPNMIEQLSGEKILGILPRINNLNDNPQILKDIILKHVNLNFILK